MSTFENEPVLNVRLIKYTSTTNGIARLIIHKNVHILCTFKKGALPGRKAYACHNSSLNSLINAERLALVIVSNVAIETSYSHTTHIEALKIIMKEQGITPENWESNIKRRSTLNAGDIIIKGYRRASTAPQSKNLKHIVNEPVGSAQRPRIWRLALERYCTRSAQLFTSSQSIIFTDARKLGTSVTVAVHQASSGLNHSFEVLGDEASLNTALRGELARIHRSLTLLTGPQHQGPESS